jgi:hypothetical protein
MDIQDELGGAAGVLLHCLNACNSDVRASVLNNIVICGGGAMISGKIYRNAVQACVRV